MNGTGDLHITSEDFLEELRKIMKTYQKNLFPGLDSHQIPPNGIQIHLSLCPMLLTGSVPMSCKTGTYLFTEFITK
jgi:hypothetical protein